MADHTPQQRSTWCSLLALCVVGLGVSVALGLNVELGPRAQPWSDPLRLTLLHTNDIHGQVLAPRKGVAGLVALGRTIRQERDRAQAAGEEVLLLDAGDLFKGTMEGDLTNGEVVVAWMNHMRYDALTIGNHEFDHGVAIARRLALMATFPVLGANVVDDKTGRIPTWFESRSKDGLRGQAVVRTYLRPGRAVRVAVVGVTSSDMKQLTLKGVTDGLSFPDEAEAIERVLGNLPPTDLTVLLTHCGLDTDIRLARRFQDRVHVIVGGHSHHKLAQGKRVEDVLIAQAGSRAYGLGRVRVTIAPPLREGQPSRIDATATVIPAGDDLQGVLDPYVRAVQEQAGQAVGNLIGPLKRVKKTPRSSALGNLQTDLMRKATKADLAFQNKTGIRADLASGKVAARDLYAVSPFGNTVVSMKLSGAEVLELIEGMLGSGRLLEVSGGVVKFDSSRSGGRVVKVTVGGKPLQPKTVYTVATNNFLSKGGDGHAVFERGRERNDSQILLRDLLRRFLETNNPYKPVEPPEQRLVDVRK